MNEKAFQERPKYDVVWRESPSCREFSPKEAFAPFFFEGFKHEIRAGQTLINFGCGTARVALEFMARGLNTTLVDISPYSLDEEVRKLLPLFSNQIHFVQACLWHLPETLKSSYWIYCCDVLEHIPEDYIDPVLKGMSKRMRFGGYFSVCLKEGASGRTVKEKGWWEEKLLKHFIICGEDALADDLYFNCRVLYKQ